NPPGSRLVDRTGSVRSLDPAGSAVPRPPLAPDQGLENARARRIRLLFLPLLLPAAALGRDAGAVPGRRPASTRPVRRGRHRRAGLRAPGLCLAPDDAPRPLALARLPSDASQRRTGGQLWR